MSEFPLKDMLEQNARLIARVRELEFTLADNIAASQKAVAATVHQLQEQNATLRWENDKLRMQMAHDKKAFETELASMVNPCPKCGRFNPKGIGLCPSCLERAERHVDMYYAFLDADAQMIGMHQLEWKKKSKIR